MTVSQILELLKQNTKNVFSRDYKPNSTMLFKDYFINYLISRDGEIRSRSYSITLTMAVHIINGLGNYRMSEINKDILKKFVNGFAKKKYLKNPKTMELEYYSQSSINKVYNLLHGAIKEAASEDGDKLLKMDYMANIKKPRTKKRQKDEQKALTDDEIKKLSAIVSDNRMVNTWIHIILYTGVRPSEALALKWDDIDYKEKTISICRTLSQEDFYDTKHLVKLKPSAPIITDLKNERDDGRMNWQRRTLKIGNRLLQILKAWEIYVKGNTDLMKMKYENKTEDFLFCGPHGQLWLYEYYSQVYKRLLKKHGLKYSDYNPYRFRHNYCTRLLRLNVNLKAAQLIMGDNTPEMVMRVYANLDSSDVLKGSEDFSYSIDSVFGLCDNNVSPDKTSIITYTK